MYHSLGWHYHLWFSLFLCLTSSTDIDMMTRVPPLSSLVLMADIPKWSQHRFPPNPGITLSSSSTQISRWLLPCYQSCNARHNLISMTELKHKLTDIIDCIGLIFVSQTQVFFLLFLHVFNWLLLLDLQWCSIAWSSQLTVQLFLQNHVYITMTNTIRQDRKYEESLFYN